MKYIDLLCNLLWDSIISLPKPSSPKDSQAFLVFYRSMDSSLGSIENALSGPLSERLRVKCLSITEAPTATAAVETVVPRV